MTDGWIIMVCEQSPAKFYLLEGVGCRTAIPLALKEIHLARSAAPSYAPYLLLPVGGRRTVRTHSIQGMRAILTGCQPYLLVRLAMDIINAYSRTDACARLFHPRSWSLLALCHPEQSPRVADSPSRVPIRLTNRLENNRRRRSAVLARFITSAAVMGTRMLTEHA